LSNFKKSISTFLVGYTHQWLTLGEKLKILGELEDAIRHEILILLGTVRGN
jgi:hypothetical protein